MSQSDKDLVKLKLVLKEYNIHIGQYLIEDEEPINYDIICACIALTQIVHPMGYSFGIQNLSNRHKLRCNELVHDVYLINSKVETGELLYTEKKYKLKKHIFEQIGKIHSILNPPDENISVYSWIYMLGLYLIADKSMDQDESFNIFANEYRNFIPYLDIAEERIKRLQFYG